MTCIKGGFELIQALVWTIQILTLGISSMGQKKKNPKDDVLSDHLLNIDLCFQLHDII